MANELPQDLLDKLGAAKDAARSQKVADKDAADKQAAIKVATDDANAAKSVAANLKTAASNAQAQAVQALQAWLLSDDAAPVEPPAPTPPTP